MEAGFLPTCYFAPRGPSALTSAEPQQQQQPMSLIYVPFGDLKWQPCSHNMWREAVDAGQASSCWKPRSSRAERHPFKLIHIHGRALFCPRAMTTAQGEPWSGKISFPPELIRQNELGGCVSESAAAHKNFEQTSGRKEPLPLSRCFSLQ